MLYRTLLIVMLISSPAAAASFECDRASHPLEKLICATPALSKLDDDVAQIYHEKMEIMFDTGSLRAVQSNWQQVLRTKCETSCTAPDVAKTYRDQIAVLQDLDEEIYTANYKTADLATLEITHLNKNEFDFTLIRDYVEDPGLRPLCLFPAEDSEAGAIAKMQSDRTKAQWSNGTCTLDFNLKRNDKGDVVEIALAGSEQCRSYCDEGKFSLDDHYIPENYWATGNQ